MADEPAVPMPSAPPMIEEKDPSHEQEQKLATVKMLLQSIGQTATVAFPLRSPANVLKITFKGKAKRRMTRSIHHFLSN
jgi:hypothetical protein